MPVAQHDITLHAPPDRVWAFIIALRYLPLWLSDVAAVQAISTSQTQAGTTFEIVRAGGRGMVEHWIVLDWEPPRSLRLTEYHADLHLRLRLEPTAGGTCLAAQLEWRQPRGLLQRLLPPTAQRRTLERSLHRLAELIDLNRDIRLLHGMGEE
ncbi:MAG TPA: SRPBCC family protein [Herpetosiphonaceae bacterium]